MQAEQTSKTSPRELIPFHQHPALDSNSPDCECAWMDEYFNEEVLESRFALEPRVSNILNSQNTCSSLPLENEPKGNAVLRKTKSIFHNFQKHVLTLLKKIIIVKKSEFAHLPSGNRAYDLWKIFKGLGSSAKKNLYIIFGVAQRENEKNLKNAAQSIPELQQLLLKYSLKQIEEGQELLRWIVYRQASGISKMRLNAQCKMKKIQEFYLYFKGFIEQLSEGAISRRMTKERKLRLSQIQEAEQ